MIESIDVGVNYARFVIERILNELECGQPQTRQQHVISAVGWLVTTAAVPTLASGAHKSKPRNMPLFTQETTPGGRFG